MALLCGLVLVATGIAAASYLVKPAKARSFDLFYGAMYINDDTSPVAVDLASGKPTVRLTNAFTAVAADSGRDIDVYPLGGGNTLLLDRNTGEFNIVDSTGFVVKSADGGVPLPKSRVSTTSTAVASGSSAYIVRRSATSTSVYLVGPSTVAAAIGSASGAKARAYATLKQPLATDPVAAVSVDDGLWVLTSGGGGTREITELTVPAGSNTGVTLTPTPHGTVTGPAALASATRNADGSGGDVAGVASADTVAVFRDGVRTEVPVSVGPGVDRILSAGDAQGALDFLYHSDSGWSQVTVAAAAGRTARVKALQSIPADAQLATPAQSDDRTYTMDTAGQGELWQIDPDGTAEVVPGAPTYPLKHGEQPEFDGAQVVADGGRVIFNSRANLRAEVVFSDGTHGPRAINKHAAVQVDPSGATELADAHARPDSRRDKTPKQNKTVKHPTQAINTKIDCKASQQVPRVPTLVAGERGARSISLSWIYTKLDPSDCYPSTFVVDVKAISSNAPSPQLGQVKVQGQNGVTITGLFPATEYELTVTAYIFLQHTSSAPIRVTTGPEGPAAPTNVRATTDSSGNWTVSWNSCGGISQGCVPTTSWNLIPSFCDGRGLSNVPAKLTFPGDPTVHSFSHVYQGSDALLGRGMCFEVQGVSPDGTVGTTSAPSRPAYSWTPPNAAALKLTASQPANTSFGGSTTTTVDLDLGADPVRDVGGVGAAITLSLSGPGAPQSKTITWDGRSDRVAATFPGVRAGGQYTATASIAPPRQPGEAVTKGPVTVTTRANWPSITAQASCPGDGGAVTLSCTLVVQLSGPSSAQANGERFDLTDSGLVCGGGNSRLDLSKSDFDPANDSITQNVDLLQYNGSCTVDVQLVESGPNGTGPEVFGGTTSPLISSAVDLGQASALDAGRGDFSATFDANNPTATIHYDGDHDAASKLTFNWHEQVHAPDGTACGGDNTGESGQPDVTVNLRPYESCAETQGDQSGWTFDISYQDVRDGTTHEFNDIAIPGKPSGFIPPCQLPANDFDAQWSGTSDAPSVTVTFDGSGADLRGCSGFSYTLFEPGLGGPVHGRQCTSADEGDSPPQSTDLSAASCQDDLTLPGNWQVEVTYSSARHDANPIDVTVTGQQPTPTPTPPPSGPSSGPSSPPSQPPS